MSNTSVEPVFVHLLIISAWLLQKQYGKGCIMRPRNNVSGLLVRNAIFILDDSWRFGDNPLRQPKYGVVTLRGTVDNLKAKRAAAQDARNTVLHSRISSNTGYPPLHLPQKWCSVLINEVISMNRLQLLLLLLQAFLLIGVIGCVHPISHELRVKAGQNLTYPLVALDPDSYTGQTVIWGGVIILIRSQPNKSILIIRETPLDYWGVPRSEEYSRGRFIARVSRYLDEEIYGKGKKVTLAGDIVGEKTRHVDGMQARYPVVRVQEIQLFGEKHYFPAPNSDFNHRGHRRHFDEPSPFHGIY
jgi:outer membrane lipoprotein